MSQTGASRHIGILLFDGVEELDAVGPYEVLAWWTQTHPEDGFTVFTFSDDGAPVTAAKGLLLGAQRRASDVETLEILVHPGGRGTRALMREADHLEWIRRTRESAAIMASVCTGSLVYAAAGLLSGRPATTHWAAVEELMQADPTVQLRADDRYVDDGDVISSAGVSAGIDMALHLVRRLAGEDRAREVRRGIQYDPQPPV